MSMSLDFDDLDDLNDLFKSFQTFLYLLIQRLLYNPRIKGLLDL